VAISTSNSPNNPTAGTIDTRLDLSQTQDPGLTICSLLAEAAPPVVGAGGGKPPNCRSPPTTLHALPNSPWPTPSPRPPLSISAHADPTLGGLLPTGTPR